jgi:hypothetical protein
MFQEALTPTLIVGSVEAVAFVGLVLFIAPLDVIEQAAHLIVSGEIINYRYDSENEEIVIRS